LLAVASRGQGILLEFELAKVRMDRDSHSRLFYQLKLALTNLRDQYWNIMALISSANLIKGSSLLNYGIDQQCYELLLI
jgi:hypothetical protein